MPIYRGSAPNMVTLVFKHFGAWGSAAEVKIEKTSKNVDGQQIARTQ